MCSALIAIYAIICMLKTTHKGLTSISKKISCKKKKAHVKNQKKAHVSHPWTHTHHETPNVHNQAFVTNQLDEISATGKFPDLPGPDEVAKTLSKELRNVFSSTPEDLETPDYTVVSKTPNYEIREYAPFTVATRGMGSASEAYSQRSARTFNSLASFLFGKNSENVGMCTMILTGF